MSVRERRYTVVHTDGREVEVVPDLDLYTARRLVEHEHNAGRSAFMQQAPERPGRAAR